MRIFKDTLNWKYWNPGVDNDHLTVKEVYDTIPDANIKVPFLVWLLENPDSPMKLHGAINIIRHDIVHILLGRGLLPQDEAFVIGFTMGTVKKDHWIQKKLFEFVSSKLYPSYYRFKDNDLISFNLGYKLGKVSKCIDIANIPLESYFYHKISDLRKIVGIDQYKLRSIFIREQLYNPDSFCSKRLDIDVDGADPSSIKKPDGLPSDWIY